MIIADDFHRAFRSLWKSPQFSGLTIVALALGIGATVSALMIVDAVFIRPLPGISLPEELVSVYTDDRNTAGIDYGSISYPDYSEYSQSTEELLDLAAYARFSFVLGSERAAEPVTVELVSGNFFELVGAFPAIGRGLAIEDDRVGAAPVAVISYGLWESRFATNPDVVGTTIRLNRQMFTVVGVAPTGFSGVLMDWIGRPDIWVPMTAQPQLLGTDLLSRRVPWHMVVGRLRNGTSIDQAEVALNLAARDVELPNVNEDPTAERRLILIPATQGRFFPGIRARVAVFLSALVGIAFLTLLVVGLNVGNLLLTRILFRDQEIAIKLALGAGVWRAARQVVFEIIIILVTAATVGIWLASWTSVLLERYPEPFQTPIDLQLELDWRLVGMAFLLTLIVGTLLALIPLIYVFRQNVLQTLKSDLVVPLSFGRLPIRQLGLFGQVALATILAATAGASARDVAASLAIESGIQTEGVVAGSLNLMGESTPGRTNFYEQLQSNIATLPGAGSATIASNFPLSGRRRIRSVRPSDREITTEAALTYVGSNYFAVVGATLQGQEFTGRTEDQNIAIINEVLAERFWPDTTAIGQYIEIPGEDIDHQVVGVARISNCVDLVATPEPCLFLPFPSDSPEAVVLIKSEQNANISISDLRDRIAQLNRDVPFYDVIGMSQYLKNRFSGPRLIATLAITLGTIAVSIAALGGKCANLSWKLKRLQTLWFDGIGRNNIKPVRERSRDEESVTFGEKTQEEASTG